MHSAPNTHTQKNQTLKPECLHRQQALMHQLLHITLLPRERMCPCMRPYECIMRVFICCPYGYLRLFPSSITQRAR